MFLNKKEELASKLGYKNTSSIAKIETGTNDIVQSTEKNEVVIIINVFGRVAAGIPIEAIEEIIDAEEITEDMAKTREFFGLQIHGNSMEPRIY